MEKDELLTTLERLHLDLSETDEVDPEAERLLRAVTEDIQRLLDDEKESPPEDSKSLSTKLESLTLSWEEEHPQIAQLIGRIASALANFGI